MTPRPVCTPGRRRQRRRLVLVAPLLVAAVAVVARLAWPETASDPPVAEASAGAALEPRRAGAGAGDQERLVATSEPVSVHRFRPPLGARAAIVVEAATGRVLWAKHEDARLPIASTTKIMTAVLALERLGLNEVVTIDRSVRHVEPLREGLRAGERVPAWKLLYALLLFSANDSARALAIGAAGSPGAFIALMNRKARELGLADTHFSTVSGVVDRHNYSTARDLALLARYAMRDERFRTIVRTRIKRVRWPAPTYGKVYVNKNRLLTTYRGADGVKTGWTTLADHCLVASARRRGVHLVAVVLGSENAFRDATRLLTHGFAVASA